MKFPISWLRDFISLPVDVTADQVAEALLRQGLEVESVSHLGEDLVGPVVVARVLTVEVLTEFKKPIRWVSVDAGEGDRPLQRRPGARREGGRLRLLRPRRRGRSDGRRRPVRRLSLIHI